MSGFGYFLLKTTKNYVSEDIFEKDREKSD